MATAPVVPAGLTAAEYEQIFAGAGTYEGNDKAYRGKSWGDIYHALWAANEGTAAPLSAYQIALKTETLVVLQGDGAALVSSLGNFVTISGKSVVGGIDQFNSANPLASVESFLGALSSKNTWLRVVKVIVGGALIVVGMSKLTGAGSAVKSVASKVPVIL